MSSPSPGSRAASVAKTRSSASARPTTRWHSAAAACARPVCGPSSTVSARMPCATSTMWKANATTPSRCRSTWFPTASSRWPTCRPPCATTTRAHPSLPTATSPRASGPHPTVRRRPPSVSTATTTSTSGCSQRPSRPSRGYARCALGCPVRWEASCGSATTRPT